ncbi:MAG: GNAT family N-acetyltransferase [Syntrophobacteraceae bacterium]|nr:GNAT family N-acetyltransferase [Syntrophobacteraceae bacterium]
MEEMVGKALENILNERGMNRRSIQANLLKSLLLKYVLPVRRMDGLRTKLDLLPSGMAISDRMLKVLDVSFEFSESDRARIPGSGPLIAVANHPFGAVEGMILSSILTAARGEARIMANFLLGALGNGELDKVLLYVDPYDSKGATRQNVKPLREAIDWVRGGMALGIFPAGEVSRVHGSQLGVIDSQWSPTVARIIRKTEASVLPVYFEGRNSLIFCALGLIHPLLRSMMLPRENILKEPRRVRVHIGKPVSFRKLAGLDDSSMMDYLRLRTYNLKNRKAENRLRLPYAPSPAPALSRQPVARGKAAGLIAEEINGLPLQQRLLSTKSFHVFCASADQVPNTIHEIGRLREITFRGAGEGTGRPLDIDPFDSYYQHIILWDPHCHEIVGGYRLGQADAILEAHGVRGLYTNTLFDYQGELFSRIGPSLELGRSFVRPEYQKTYQPLLLLWSAIGSFVAGNPRYRFLFGAVSISNDYMGISRRLIVRYLRAGHTRSDLAGFVRARQPVSRWHAVHKDLGPTYSTISDINDFSEVISDIEKDAKGIPILLKHYVKLGGQFLGFCEDPAFCRSIDALVLVDLAHTEPKILERYMGQSGSASFLRFHGVGDVAADQKCA